MESFLRHRCKSSDVDRCPIKQTTLTTQLLKFFHVVRDQVSHFSTSEAENRCETRVMTTRTQMQAKISVQVTPLLCFQALQEAIRKHEDSRVPLRGCRNVDRAASARLIRQRNIRG